MSNRFCEVEQQVGSINLAIQIPPDIMQRIQIMSKNIDLIGYVSGQYPEFRYVMQEYAWMLSEAIVEFAFNNPGYFMEVQSSYHEDIVTLMQSNTRLRDPWTAADDYLQLAYDMVQRLLNSGQLDPLYAYAKSIGTQQHITVTLDGPPVVDPNGTFIARYTVNSLSEE